MVEHYLQLYQRKTNRVASVADIEAKLLEQTLRSGALSSCIPSVPPYFDDRVSLQLAVQRSLRRKSSSKT